MNIEAITETTPHGGTARVHTVVSKTAKLEKRSSAYGNAEILGNARVYGESIIANFGKVMENAEVRASRVSDHARVGGFARVEDSWIEDTADVRGEAIVRYSVVKGNAIISDKAFLENCIIACNARVLGNAKLYNVYFRSDTNGDINNTIMIEGDAELAFPVPLELSPGTRIHEGLWTRPPLVIDTPVFPTIEGVGDRVQIGCQSRPLDFWFKKGLDALIRYGLDHHLYDEFYEAMRTMRAHKEEFGSPENPRRKKR